MAATCITKQPRTEAVPVTLPTTSLVLYYTPKAFIFVTDGIESALEKAKAAAGAECLDRRRRQGYSALHQAGLLDELKLHVVLLLLGGGTSMFGELGEFIELDKAEVEDEPGVTHLYTGSKKPSRLQ